MAFTRHDASLLLVLMRSGQLGTQVYEVFLVLCGQRKAADGISPDTLKVIERLELGRRDFDVIGQSDVFLLTAKGKKVRDEFFRELQREKVKP